MKRRETGWAKLNRLIKEMQEHGDRKARERDQDRAGEKSDKDGTNPFIATHPTITIAGSDPHPVVSLQIQSEKPLSIAEMRQLINAAPLSFDMEEKPLVIPAPEVPTYIEPVVGWRGWVIARSGILRSAFNHERHYYTEVKFDDPRAATCLNHRSIKSEVEELPHHAPQFKCNCGYHMGHYEYQAYTPFTRGNDGGKWPAAVGQAKVWGRVIEHKGGWRGEYVYPVELNVIPNPHGKADWLHNVEDLKRVANRCSLLYDIPVTVMDLDDWMDIQTASMISERNDREAKNAKE